jgi:hypothetical protein
MPARAASSSVSPTVAISGSVKVHRGNRDGTPPPLRGKEGVLQGDAGRGLRGGGVFRVEAAVSRGKDRFVGGAQMIVHANAACGVEGDKPRVEVHAAQVGNRAPWRPEFFSAWSVSSPSGRWR